jgi:hypothetical protein
MSNGLQSLPIYSKNKVHYNFQNQTCICNLELTHYKMSMWVLGLSMFFLDMTSLGCHWDIPSTIIVIYTIWLAYSITIIAMIVISKCCNMCWTKLQIVSLGQIFLTQWSNVVMVLIFVAMQSSIVHFEFPLP